MVLRTIKCLPLCAPSRPEYRALHTPSSGARPPWVNGHSSSGTVPRPRVGSTAAVSCATGPRRRIYSKVRPTPKDPISPVVVCVITSSGRPCGSKGWYVRTTCKYPTSSTLRVDILCFIAILTMNDDKSKIILLVL